MTTRITDDQIDHYARILDGLTHLSIEASRELLTEARRARKAEAELQKACAALVPEWGERVRVAEERAKELEAKLAARPEPAPTPTPKPGALPPLSDEEAWLEYFDKLSVRVDSEDLVRDVSDLLRAYAAQSRIELTRYATGWKAELVAAIVEACDEVLPKVTPPPESKRAEEDGCCNCSLIHKEMRAAAAVDHARDLEAALAPYIDEKTSAAGNATSVATTDEREPNVNTTGGDEPKTAGPFGVTEDPCPIPARMLTHWRDGSIETDSDGEATDGHDLRAGFAWLYRENERRKYEIVKLAGRVTGNEVSWVGHLEEQIAGLESRLDALEKHPWIKDGGGK